MASTVDLIGSLRRIEFETRLQRASGERQELSERTRPTGPLHITYVMNQVGVSGGARIIFEHANRLLQLGTKVTLVSHFPRPDWHPIHCDYVQVPFQTELAHGIPECDVIVATYWDHISSCIETGIAPVVYFEQGDFHLFEPVEPRIFEMVEHQLQMPAHLITVSAQAAQCLRERYGRESKVFHNALDRTVFHPPAEGLPRRRPYMLAIGSDRTEFKGVTDVIAAYRAVVRAGHDLDLVWVTPEPPANPVGQVFIKPEQPVLAELYRGAAIFVSGSRYESFSLPVLEAMACGCPVVSTRNAGVLEYAVDGDNCLLGEVRDPGSLADKIMRILSDQLLRERLVAGGLETAGRFDWDKTIPVLQEHYQILAGFEPKIRRQLSEWVVRPETERFVNPQGQKLLQRLLSATDCTSVEAPVLYELIPGHLTARWEVIAHRPGQDEPQVYRAYLALRGNLPQLPYGAAFSLFASRQYQEALNQFVGTYQAAADPREKAVLVRWIVLCLIELGRDEQAYDVLVDSMAAYPDNTDLAYLQCLILTLAGRRGEVSDIAERISLFGESALYPEFWWDLGGLLVENLHIGT